MARPFRSVLLAVALVGAIALVAPRGVSTNAAPTTVDQHTAVAAAAITTTVRTVSDRVPKPALPVSALALVASGLGAVALLRARHDRLIGRRLRVLHDVGHDWRSLLLGAPPVRA